MLRAKNIGGRIQVRMYCAVCREPLSSMLTSSIAYKIPLEDCYEGEVVLLHRRCEDTGVRKLRSADAPVRLASFESVLGNAVRALENPPRPEGFGDSMERRGY